MLELGRAQGWFGPMKGVYLGGRLELAKATPGARVLTVCLFQEENWSLTNWSWSGVTARLLTSSSGERRRRTGGDLAPLAVWRSSLSLSSSTPGRHPTSLELLLSIPDLTDSILF